MIPLERLKPWETPITLPMALKPNFSERPLGARIWGIVLADAPGLDDAEMRMMTAGEAGQPRDRISCHLHFRRSGPVARLVPDELAAWSAMGPALDGGSLVWRIAPPKVGGEHTEAQYRAVAEALEHYLPQQTGRLAVVSQGEVLTSDREDPHGWDWVRMWSLVWRIAPPEEGGEHTEAQYRAVAEVLDLAEVGPGLHAAVDLLRRRAERSETDARALRLAADDIEGLLMSSRIP